MVNDWWLMMESGKAGGEEDRATLSKKLQEYLANLDKVNKFLESR